MLKVFYNYAVISKEDKIRRIMTENRFQYFQNSTITRGFLKEIEEFFYGMTEQVQSIVKVIYIYVLNVKGKYSPF